MNNEQGVLTKENTKAILSGVDRSFFNGGFSKLGSGATSVKDANMPAMALLHQDNVLSSGLSPDVKNMDRATEIVKKADSQYLIEQATRQQGYDR